MSTRLAPDYPRLEAFYYELKDDDPRDPLEPLRAYAVQVWKHAERIYETVQRLAPLPRRRRIGEALRSAQESHEQFLFQTFIVRERARAALAYFDGDAQPRWLSLKQLDREVRTYRDPQTLQRKLDKVRVGAPEVAASFELLAQALKPHEEFRNVLTHQTMVSLGVMSDATTFLCEADALLDQGPERLPRNLLAAFADRTIADGTTIFRRAVEFSDAVEVTNGMPRKAPHLAHLWASRCRLLSCGIRGADTESWSIAEGADRARHSSW